MVATPARLNIVGKDEAYISGREPEEFAAQIIKALADRDEALAKAQKARKLVEEKYDWQILAPLYGKAVAKAIGIPIEP
jgi:glycosyltransferase involved in cell wall biosynthesis